MAGDDRRRGEIITASRLVNENQKQLSGTPLLNGMDTFTIETLRKLEASPRIEGKVAAVSFHNSVPGKFI